MIHLKNITKHYKNHTALDNVNLHIQEGYIYGIIGESGAGKSTLVRCINLLESPDTGQIIVDNDDITQLKGKALREKRHTIGMIFQHFNLLNSRTVFGNISLPLELNGKNKTEINNTITPLLELTGLSDKKNAYPAQLSGGQKQRVAIARALANEPKILLCDEATSALDPNTTKSILSLLKDINSRLGITIVLITHEMDVARAICDEIAVMSQGKIIETNSTEQIFLNPQEKLTRQFVHSVTHEKNIIDCSSDDQRPETQQYSLVRLAFIGEQATDPIVSQAARKFDIDFSILYADIETINGKSMGFLLVKLLSNQEKTSKVLDFFKSQHITVEVIDYA